MILFSNNATTTLAGAISPTSVQVNVSAGAGVLFPNPTGGDYFICTLYKNDTSGLFEIVHCTQRVTDTLTIVRGQEGTNALQWNPGDSLSSLITAGAMQEFLQATQRGIPEAPVDGKPYARENAGWTNTPFVRPPDPVWPPVSWATSSWVYNGADTGTKNALVVPVTTPDMTALAVGTLITVKVLQSNDGPSTLKIKNFPAYSIVQLNGEQIGAKLTAGNTMEFWFDGSKFYAPVHPAPVSGTAPGGDVPVDNPLPCHFYCDCINGIDDIKIRDGLSLQKAWKTLAKCIEFIETHYASRPKVFVHCSHGTYEPCQISKVHVAEWEFLGDDTGFNCHIDARNHPSAYIAFTCAGAAKVLMHGFTFWGQTYGIYCTQNAVLTIHNCRFWQPYLPAGYVGAVAPVLCNSNAIIYFGHEIHYQAHSTVPHNAFCHLDTGAVCHWGWEDQSSGFPCNFHFDNDSYFIKGPLWCYGNSIVNVWHDGCTWLNSTRCHGPKFWCETGSGFEGCKGDINWWAGDQPGWCDAGSFSYYR